MAMKMGGIRRLLEYFTCKPCRELGRLPDRCQRIEPMIPFCREGSTQADGDNAAELLREMYKILKFQS